MSPSQIEKEGNKSVIFYVCHSNGQLKVKPKTWQVCIPNAKKIPDPITHKLRFDETEIKTITFHSGVYETEDPLEIAFLRMYNSGGVLPNGYKVSSNNITYVVEEKDFLQEQKAKEVEVVREVVKEVAPEYLIKTMDLKGLQKFAKHVGCNEATKEGLQKGQIIDILTAKGYVKKDTE